MVEGLAKHLRCVEVDAAVPYSKRPDARFQLKISEDQLMSRCTKCNGRFIQKPLTTEEAIEASKGFQVIPNCLFNKNLEFGGSWTAINFTGRGVSQCGTVVYRRLPAKHE
ncbi:uncharacterized protein [Primulina huaijiensis]|uniref:uncharacterized protein isoform X3 n=1 Tax=Primulina huaijiensis TaxID=1492673 RepID=UPI003CC6F7DB